MARELAVEAVKKGAGECLVRAVYAPNVAEPLDVQVEVSGGDAGVPMEGLVHHGPVRRQGSSPSLRSTSLGNSGLFRVPA